MIRNMLISGALLLTSCSTPVGGNYDDFLNMIRNMPAGDGKAARREEAHWRALEELRSRDPSSKVGTVHCKQSSGASAEMPIYVRQIIDCLALTKDMTFALCVETRVDDITQSYINAEGIPPDPGARCEFVPNPEFVTDEKWDPDQIDEEDLAYTAIRADKPPAWMIAAGIVIVVGGAYVFAPGWAVALCTLDATYACDQSGDK